MTEISADDDFLMSGHPGGSTRPPITNISQWVERFSMMAAILSTRFPEKAPELFAYQGSIIRAERNYEGKQWVVYDRQFRREALARKDLNWSVPNLRLYNEAFTGRAKAIPRCSVCLQMTIRQSHVPRIPQGQSHGTFRFGQPRPRSGTNPGPRQTFVETITMAGAGNQTAATFMFA